MTTQQTYSAAEDRALEKLKAAGFVPFSEIRTVTDLNAFRALTMHRMARFAIIDQKAGYALLGRSFLSLAVSK